MGLLNKQSHRTSSKSDHEEEEEEETAAAKKKKGKAMNVTEESKKMRVVEVDSDENTEKSDENDMPILPMCVVWRAE